MQFYLGFAVLSIALAYVNAQFNQGASGSYPSGIQPGGETLVSEDKPNVQEAKKLVLQELQNQASYLPGSPSVDISDFSAKEQVVAGTRYNLTFKATYIYSTGEKTTKSCGASVIKPLGSPDAKMTFTDDSDPKDKVKCVPV